MAVDSELYATFVAHSQDDSQLNQQLVHKGLIFTVEN